MQSPDQQQLISPGSLLETISGRLWPAEYILTRLAGEIHLGIEVGEAL